MDSLLPTLICLFLFWLGWLSGKNFEKNSKKV